MEVSYMVALLISIFCHCIGLFYNPVEASTESTVFLIIAIMFLHKLKSERRPNSTESRAVKILEVVGLCVAIQVLLVAFWFPVFQILRFLVDSTCKNLRNSLSDEKVWIVEQINQSAVTVILLGMESAWLLKGFEINDVQKFFGSKDDCISDSVLALVAKEEINVLRLEKKKLQKERFFQSVKK
ncbi:uncharacterized protein LOC119548387 [Drosophila subpulchrella]|uniref:uncharacterized protein LOC119548387 n=1 Tax=Drosophila subpulchrella TaxID=1486046 RepID=UPI0018A1AFFA|nr:uncharacterized protein LOC119548387 [Drosophila subpulchrella]